MSASPSTIPAASPPWPLIHFDVHCARCGHDLRGQSDPTCPACNLEFTWSQAAPLEQLTCAKCNYHLYGLCDSRCPECGTTVDWNEALLRFRRREKPLFEYCWRQRPIRSFFRTWLLAFRPKRLWQTVDIHDPPQVRPLIVWTIILLGITTVSVPFWLGITMTLGMMRAFWGPGVPQFYYVDYLVRTWLSLFGSPAFWFSALLFALWWVFSLAALLLFQQSMRLCKVRSVHVFRVCAYSLAPLLPLYVFLMSSANWVFVQRMSRSSFRLYGAINPTSILTTGGFLFVVWSLRQAYRHYIRMPHTLGVAFASQVIALLATAGIPPAVIYLLRGGW